MAAIQATITTKPKPKAAKAPKAKKLSPEEQLLANLVKETVDYGVKNNSCGAPLNQFLADAAGITVQEAAKLIAEAKGNTPKGKNPHRVTVTLQYTVTDLPGQYEKFLNHERSQWEACSEVLTGSRFGLGDNGQRCTVEAVDAVLEPLS